MEVFDKTVRRLEEWEFRPSPQNWLRLHQEWLDAVIEYLDMLLAMPATDLRESEHPIGLLIRLVHVKIAVLNEAGNAMVCPRFPLCKWRMWRQVEEKSS